MFGRKKIKQLEKDVKYYHAMFKASLICIELLVDVIAKIDNGDGDFYDKWTEFKGKFSAIVEVQRERVNDDS